MNTLSIDYVADESTPTSQALRETLVAALPTDTWHYFARNSLSFSFASRGFGEADRKRVSRVYAFCRLTDDLVDSASHAPRQVIESRLDAWLALSHRAYEHHDTGIGWLDDIMAESARAGVPFRLIAELVEGVRMDLGTVALQSIEDLDHYAYLVASVVGIWLCYLFGITGTWEHERAAALGRAMQITNILRDVGEDLHHGRIYLPADLLHVYGLSLGDLRSMQAGGLILPAYRQLIEALMARADAYYEQAWEGITALPPRFGRVMAVAAPVYRGIHRRIRHNEYNNLTLRAHTSFFEKVWLGLQGRRHLARLKRSK